MICGRAPFSDATVKWPTSGRQQKLQLSRLFGRAAEISENTIFGYYKTRHVTKHSKSSVCLFPLNNHLNKKAKTCCPWQVKANSFPQDGRHPLHLTSPRHEVSLEQSTSVASIPSSVVPLASNKKKWVRHGLNIQPSRTLQNHGSSFWEQILIWYYDI